MVCPHCRIAFHDEEEVVPIGTDVHGAWVVARVKCAACNRLTLSLRSGKPVTDQWGQLVSIVQDAANFSAQVYPKGSSRPSCPVEVPRALMEDYTEACLVLAESPKASAALSRRCMQQLLRDAAKVDPADLASEIQQVLDTHALPSYLADVIDAVRNIGNFSAHPIKSKQTGEIVPVEPEEAGWNLEVLESLFDFYYVQPRKAARKTDSLNEKLAAAGKPPMKQLPPIHGCQ
jgi:hypothetical protein